MSPTDFRRRSKGVGFIMKLDKYGTDSIKVRSKDLQKREQDILTRIKRHYGKKFGKDILTEEAKEIAESLLNFIKAIYGE